MLSPAKPKNKASNLKETTAPYHYVLF